VKGGPLSETLAPSPKGLEVALAGVGGQRPERLLADLTTLCGEPITHLESRRLVAKKDAPWYRFAVGHSGEIYHLEGHEIEDGENPGQTRMLAVKARKVREAAEDIQRAAVSVGHKLPPKEREDLRYMSALTDGQLRALARYSPRKSPRVTLTPCRCVLEVRPCLEHLATPIGYACARCGHRAECHGKRENRDV
jgi:hypothetical protein